MKKYFDIFGVRAKIKTYKADIDTINLMGYAKKSPMTVMIENSISKEDWNEVTCHEAIHLLLYRVGLEQVIHSKINEIICETVSKFIVENYDPKR